MKKYMLDLREYQEVDAIHDYIAGMMDFPAYYGKNLDALFDVLTDIREYSCIVIRYKPGKDIERFIRKLIGVFAEAEEENERLALFVWDK